MQNIMSWLELVSLLDSPENSSWERQNRYTVQVLNSSYNMTLRVLLPVELRQHRDYVVSCLKYCDVTSRMAHLNRV